MSWYRRIDIRVHGDARVRRLTKPQPNGQTLWMYLLTGPHTANGLPGLFSISRADLAARLGWAEEALCSTWNEIEDPPALAVADWEAHVVLVPNAARYNLPKNDNIVKAWGRAFDAIPECGLRRRWIDCARKALCDEAPSRVEQFDKLFGKLLPEQTSELSRNTHTHTQTQTNTKREREASLLAEPILERIPVKGGEYPVTNAQAAAWATDFPAVDVPHALARMRLHWQAVPAARRKTERGIVVSITRWLAKDADDLAARGKPNAKRKQTAAEAQAALAALLEKEGR